MIFVTVSVLYVFCYCVIVFLFFFFKQKTAYEMRISDWSSDVCSSDLVRDRAAARREAGDRGDVHDGAVAARPQVRHGCVGDPPRAEHVDVEEDRKSVV